MCSGVESYLETWNQAGKMFTNNCKINLIDTSASQEPTLFYELCEFLFLRSLSYLQIVLAQSNNATLYPVPVRIMNTESGPDPYPSTLSLSTSKYFRRFTLVDRFTGLESGVLKHLRVPTSIQFWFRAVGSSTPGQMYIPIMDITYTDVPVSALPWYSSNFDYPVSVSIYRNPLAFSLIFHYYSLPFPARISMTIQVLTILFKVCWPYLDLLL